MLFATLEASNPGGYANAPRPGGWGRLPEFLGVVARAGRSVDLDVHGRAGRVGELLRGRERSHDL